MICTQKRGESFRATVLRFENVNNLTGLRAGHQMLVDLKTDIQVQKSKKETVLVSQLTCPVCAVSNFHHNFNNFESFAGEFVSLRDITATASVNLPCRRIKIRLRIKSLNMSEISFQGLTFLDRFAYHLYEQKYVIASLFQFKTTGGDQISDSLVSKRKRGRGRFMILFIREREKNSFYTSRLARPWGLRLNLLITLSKQLDINRTIFPILFLLFSLISEPSQRYRVHFHSHRGLK